MELGNLMFNTNNQNQLYECPLWVVALLREIESQISRVYWNKNHQEWNSAFGNTGNEFHNSIIDIHAYAWEEDNEVEANFKCNNIEISWYKYLGRDTTINIDPESKDFKEVIVNMFDKAIESVLNMEDYDD